MTDADLIPSAKRADKLISQGFRRTFIYPHRSVRSLRLTAGQVMAAIAVAAAQTALVVWLHEECFRIHHSISSAILTLTGIPLKAVQQVQVYPIYGPAPVAVFDVLRLDQHPVLFLSLFAGAILMLLAVHRRFPLVRGLVVFVMALVWFGAVDILWQPEKQLGAVEFTTSWLRSEVLVWLVLPWFAAAMMIAPNPRIAAGAGLSVLTLAICYVWSAVRLALSLATLHVAGTLFLPFFWFALGFLADVVLLIVAYSIAVYLAAKRLPSRAQ